MKYLISFVISSMLFVGCNNSDGNDVKNSEPSKTPGVSETVPASVAQIKFNARPYAGQSAIQTLDKNFALRSNSGKSCWYKQKEISRTVSYVDGDKVFVIEGVRYANMDEFMTNRGNQNACRLEFEHRKYEWQEISLEKELANFKNSLNSTLHDCGHKCSSKLGYFEKKLSLITIDDKFLTKTIQEINLDSFYLFNFIKIVTGNEVAHIPFDGKASLAVNVFDDDELVDNDFKQSQYLLKIYDDNVSILNSNDVSFLHDKEFMADDGRVIFRTIDGELKNIIRIKNYMTDTGLACPLATTYFIEKILKHDKKARSYRLSNEALTFKIEKRSQIRNRFNTLNAEQFAQCLKKIDEYKENHMIIGPVELLVDFQRDGALVFNYAWGEIPELFH